MPQRLESDVRTLPSSTKIVRAIVQQHADEAAFLWLLRDAAVAEPHYTLFELCRIDERVEAHIDGLRVAGESAWSICAGAIDGGEAGQAFVAGVLALEGEDGARLAQVIEMASASNEVLQGVTAAFGWVPIGHAERWLHAMLRARSPIYRRLAIAGLGMHRWDPGESLQDLLAESDPLTLSRALRAVGELRRHDLADRLRVHLNDERTDVRFWAAWSSVLLGDPGAAGSLLGHIGQTPGSLHHHAAQLALRVLEPASARDFIKPLAQDPARLPEAIVACGASGDPLYLPWLIRHMTVPAVARKAAEAFCMITGADLSNDGLAGKPPEGFEGGPTENPEDGDVALDPDENLPWPDAQAVSAWYEKRATSFGRGVRYLCGRPISREQCRYVLEEGYQRQRAAAAYELALIDPEPLFEWRAPGWRQRSSLGVSRS